MKKTLIALSVLVAAGSVNAATVYDNDGFKVDVYGDAAVHYEKAQGSDKEAQIVLDDADFGFKVNSAINEDMSVLAVIEFDGDEPTADEVAGTDIDNGGTGVDLDDLYVGFTAAGTTAKVGKMCGLIDDVGISNDFAFGLGTAETMTGLTDCANQVVRVDYAGEGFYAAFDSISNADGADDANEDGSQIDLMVGATFGDADVNLTYGDGDISGTDADALALKGSYGLGDVTLSAIYVTASGTADIDSIGANIEYTMDKLGFNVGMASHSDDADYSEYYANVSYAVAKNATAFFEVQDSDEDDSDMGYAAGVTVKF